MRSLLKSLLPVSVIVQLQNWRDRGRLRAALDSTENQEEWSDGVIEAAQRELNSTALNRAGEAREKFKKIEALRAEWGRKPGVISIHDFGAAHSNGALQPPGVTIDLSYRHMFVYSSSSLVYGSFYHHLVRGMSLHRVLELGTNVGMSGSYIASALLLEGSGRLVTLEGSEVSSNIARQIFEAQELQDQVNRVVGPFHETLSPCLEKHGPFDLVFVDGHHDGPATIRYFNQIRPYVVPSGLIIFDDIRWNQDMYNAWGEIKGHNALAGTLDFDQIGIVMVS